MCVNYKPRWARGSEKSITFRGNHGIASQKYLGTMEMLRGENKRKRLRKSVERRGEVRGGGVYEVKNKIKNKNKNSEKVVICKFPLVGNSGVAHEPLYEITFLYRGRDSGWYPFSVTL